MRELVQYIRKIDKKWLIIWSVIYVGFLVFDLISPSSVPVTVMKMIGIILCLLYTIINAKNEPFLVCAFIFTVIADLILVVKNTSALGVFAFCLAQFFHLIRMSDIKIKSLKIYLLIVLLIFISGYFLKINPIFAAAFIYAGTLITNLILSRNWFIKEGTLFSRLGFVGFLLFAGCDICVSISYLSLTGVLPAQFYMIANYLAWMFYYPSQVFLSNSSNNMI